ncbi:MAG: phosphate ABC transporter substrate-binding protein [Leptolyngbya sp. SIO1D8]|nr:phosphate ABC transporter substrate-binding protein [Leptolyngbya sp. SIO1D8]
MTAIPKILLKTYLRRFPAPIRLNRFSFLSRYSWLKNLLEDLRPELFPPEPAPPVEAPPVEEDLDIAAIAAQLLNAKVQGRQGIYQVEQWLGPRGQGHLFSAVKLGAKQPVILKEFLLPARTFNPTEARQRQQAFTQLAGLARKDGRRQDLRLIQPLDAIADATSIERCYLITDERDASPTLRHQLREQGPFDADVIWQVLEQVLQTLLHLHQQIMVLPSGQRQLGLVHGNLTLDSLLWVEYAPKQWFVYLTDLALWEKIFDPPLAKPYTVNVTTDAICEDLRSLGVIGYRLLTGQETMPSEVVLDDLEMPQTDPALVIFIKRLLTPANFDSAEAAWQELLGRPHLAPTDSERTPVEETVATQRRVPRWLIALVSAVALVIIAGVLWRVFLRRQAPASQIAQVCCLQEVGAVPQGEYQYTGLAQGTWNYVLAQQNLGQRGQTLTSAIQVAQPELTLTYVPADSMDAAIAAVQSGEVDFAVLPRVKDLELPAELGAEVIAYDALAVFVAFSYAERQRSLPQSLRGELALADLQALYVGQIDTWRDISRTWLPIKRYAPENIEAIHIFENRVLNLIRLEQLPEIEVQPTFPMLRAILQDFETQQLGSIGFAPLSQVFGQCSIYPLALRGEQGAAVQPLVLNTGQAVTPNLDLCDRKGVYFPNAEVLQTGEYPLAYEIIVLFPQDNSRVPIGPKFAELLRTIEGQQLLREAGLAPLDGAAP